MQILYQSDAGAVTPIRNSALQVEFLHDFEHGFGVAAGVTDAVPSGRTRFVAIATIVLWLTIIFLGRSIAYDVEIWESWHLA